MDHKERAHERLVAELSEQLADGSLAIFAGAGLSVGAGYVDWAKLLTPIAEDLHLDIKKENDLVTLAQYHCNSNQANRGKLNQLLVTQFADEAELTENHRVLARLPITTFWTTNYDTTIERALQEVKKRPDVKFTPKQLTVNRPKRDAIVYKMHGDVSLPSEAILTRDDYERYHLKMKPFLTALSGDLVSKTFLFLGFSFTDPNLEYILSRVRVSYERDQRQHHCLLRRIKQQENEGQADFEYRVRKQELFAQELLRVGVKTTWVDEFSEVTELLRKLENKFKQRTVFVSGAAHDYGTWAKEDALRFVSELSKDIAARQYRVVSGFGLGIGSSVITGVLESIYMGGGRLDNDQLILRPFPQHQGGAIDLAKLWSQYRSDMIQYAGIAIFLFGNKLQDDKVVLSNGMREEFEIAKAQGAFLLPIGLTGFMAEELWNEVYAGFDEKTHKNGAAVKAKLEVLGKMDTSADEARKAILDILDLLK